MSEPVILAKSTPVLPKDSWWRRLLRQAGLILSCVLLVVAVTVYGVLQSEPVYRAVATMQFEKERVKISETNTLERSKISMAMDDPFLYTQYEKLKSRALAERVIREVDLPVTALVAPDPVVDLLAKLQIKPLARTQLLKISYESTDSALAAALVNGVMDTLIKLNQEAQPPTISLLRKMQTLQVVSDTFMPSLEVVERARLYEVPWYVQHVRWLGVAVLGGLLLGVMLALLREKWGKKPMSVQAFQAMSGLPVLGSIPRVRGFTKRRLVQGALRNLGSPTAEAYRVATANVHFSGISRAPRIVLFTSVNPAEGKSVSAAYIAIQQARQGLKVLLIDADLRKPSLHGYLGVANRRGLSDYLRGDADVATMTQAIAAVKGLYFLAAGSKAQHPANLLSQADLPQLLQRATQYFDSIVIDAPSVLGFADALYLSAVADATVIVANAEAISPSRLLHTVEQLHRVKSNIVGCLMLRSPENAPDYRHYRLHQQYASESQDAVVLIKNKHKGLNLILTPGANAVV
jgi:capsular exopolysaccharide synthesis family protein